MMMVKYQRIALSARLATQPTYRALGGLVRNVYSLSTRLCLILSLHVSVVANTTVWSSVASTIAANNLSTATLVPLETHKRF